MLLRRPGRSAADFTLLLIPDYHGHHRAAGFIMDDGDLSQGRFRQTPNGRYTYMLDE